MTVKFIIFLFIGFVLFEPVSGQLTACTVMGQTPSTAFPVCGTEKFVQTSVPICGKNSIPVPTCSGNGAGYADKNPYWYKFTCYVSGTFGFLITPNNLGDDYDWQIFDVTGKNVNSVFTNAALFVVANWSGSYGLTGASATGIGVVQCGSDPKDDVPRFSKWPTLIQGHNYLLLISHYTDSQSGYTLSFQGGTASIKDTTLPRMESLTASCDASQLTVKLNKKVLCNSLTATGSEFKLGSGAANVTSASGFGCSLGFDTDSVLIKLDKSLPSGNYQLISQTGTDGNTLLDICGTPEAVGDQLAFTVTPPMPTAMDSISPLGCAPNIIRLVFKKNIRCSSIAADGSDFMISGTNPVTIVGAQGDCNNGLSSTIDIQLSAPINLQGSYQVALKTGSDGNTIIDECAQETPAGSSLDFSTVDTVSANFNYQIHYGCGIDTVMLSNNGGPSINLWQWYFDTTGTSNQQNPQQTYTVFGDQLIVLVVSNGVCSDSAFQYVTLDNTLKADMEAPEMLCPADKANFINNSIGRNLQYSWDFGDGSTDFALTPLAHTYPNNPQADKVYTVSLVVTDDLGCKDTVDKQVRKLHSCYIAVPSAFTPNGDGLNDYLYPLNAFKASDLLFRVYNRYGQLVFETRDWSRKWDGRINGKPQGTGTYVWTLQYTDNDTQKKVVQKGTSVLIR